jgi:hypothetical protein
MASRYLGTPFLAIQRNDDLPSNGARPRYYPFGEQINPDPDDERPHRFTGHWRGGPNRHWGGTLGCCGGGNAVRSRWGNGCDQGGESCGRGTTEAPVRRC